MKTSKSKTISTKPTTRRRIAIIISFSFHQTMSSRRSFLSRRIASRSFALSSSSNNTPHSDITILPLGNSDADVDSQSDAVSWSTMLPELLGEIIKRVEAREDRWPTRRDVVACGCVCRRWREVTKDVVKMTHQGGKITFPSCLKQPGPRDVPIQCLIKRDKRNAKFYLYLALSPAFTDKGKFLLAARRFRYSAHSEYIISVDADDISQGSNAYVGKLRSDFLGTNFTVYDGEPPYSGAKPACNRGSRRFASKQICPQVGAGNYEVGQVSYKFNLLKSRGPRRMVCSLKCPWSAESLFEKSDDEKMKGADLNASSLTVLKNKAPRWHEHLQCWCLNFHGRVTVASVKNFQLVATMDQSQPGGIGDEETVLLQFGKVGDDLFTMDFRQPLSAFQAFAICLTSFGTKLACE